MEEERLASGVREVLGEHRGDVGELRLSRIPGGASRETWLIDSEGGRWVLRRDPKGSVSLVPMSDEFALIRAAAEGGVPVPEPIAFEPEGGRFGSPGLLMSHVGGTSVAPRVLRRPEFESARAKPDRAAGRGARADPRDRPGEVRRRPARVQRRSCADADRRVGTAARRGRRAAAHGRARAALASGQCARAGGTQAGSRRLQARQLHRRRAGPGGRDRLGALSPG